ncbi:hypothetical protein ACNRDG_16555 [Ralstonia pseudosolanacearum]
MSEDIQIAILKSLSASEKNWNWYTLDRALSAQGRGGQCNVAQIATLLSEQGLITISPTKIPQCLCTQSLKMAVDGLRAAHEWLGPMRYDGVDALNQ